MLKTRLFSIFLIWMASNGTFLIAADGAKAHSNSCASQPTKDIILAITEDALKNLNTGSANPSILRTKGYLIDFMDQSITILKKNYAEQIVIKNVGAELLLWAAETKQVHAISQLLKHPENLANLSAVDGQGSNALELVKAHVETLPPADNDFEAWSKIMVHLEQAFFSFGRLDESPDYSVEFRSLKSGQDNDFLLGEALHHYAEIHKLLPPMRTCTGCH